MANIYNKVPVKVQKKSGFDKSFQNLFTGKCGTITPILTDELIPNTTVNLKMAITTQLPPLASDTFMRVKQKYAAFFVPSRLLMTNYEQWLTGNDVVDNKVIMQPQFIFSPSTDKSVYGAGTLLDYLGVKSNTVTWSGIPAMQINAMPMLAYHRIYDDWFRNSLVQKSCFNVPGVANATFSAANSKIVGPTNSTIASYCMTASNANSTLADGVKLYSLRQANFGSDLFTSCTPKPQNGEAQSVGFTVSTESGEGEFTISALRAANSMQQFLERNNLAGNRLVDYVKAQYGANLSDYLAQRPVLLASGSFDVYSKGVYQTTDTTESAGAQNNNPFQSTGSRFGSAYAEGNELVIKGFTAQEPGYLMVVTWLSPKVTYSTGVDPILTRYRDAKSQADMANPILQNVGNEPIYARYLDSAAAFASSEDARNVVFGYNDRYSTWKDKQDEVHGLLRDGNSLQSFALQRTFGTTGTTPGVPSQISTSFLQIPESYLDQVSAVNGSISQYGYWCDTFFDYKVSMPLARYAIPSLQDPAAEHGEDVVIDRSGKQIS